MQPSLIDKPGQHPLELNPFWKEGGSGLPQEKQSLSVDLHKPSSSRVSDGGRSWILRSYKRALEQAESEGKSLEEIAVVRWGSLEKLHSMLRLAGIDPENPDKEPKNETREYLHSSVSKLSKQKERSERDYHVKFSSHLRTSETALAKKSPTYLKPGEGKGFEKHIASATNTSLSTSTNWQIKKPLSIAKGETSERLSTDEISREAVTSSSIRAQHPVQEHKKALANSGEPLIDSEPVTDTRLNAVAAKLMKAELLGDKGKIKRLKEELEMLRKLKESQAQSGAGIDHKSQNTMVVLATTDRLGRMRPVESSEAISKRSFPKPASGHSKKGKQKRYLDDDDGISLKSIMEEERRMTAEDTHAAIARMASKFVPASNSDETVDDALDSKSATRYNPAKEEKARRDKAIFESRKMTEILENCRYCFGNQNFDKHLLIAVGISVYLAVPSHQSLTEGHCLLFPMEHTTSSLQMDENVWSEVQIFQKGLTRMFSDHNMDVIFTECYMSATKKTHNFIECIPLPKEEGSMAPMYFKKAIQESDTEWSENKKLIDTRQKGVRNSIPIGLPYFYVEFGIDGGYAHIIEDQSKFPSYFAKEIVGGMLDIEPRLWLKPPKQSFEKQKRKVSKLSEWWEPYDWTQKLNESAHK